MKTRIGLTLSLVLLIGVLVIPGIVLAYHPMYFNSPYGLHYDTVYVTLINASDEPLIVDVVVDGCDNCYNVSENFYVGPGNSLTYSFSNLGYWICGSKHVRIYPEKDFTGGWFAMVSFTDYVDPCSLVWCDCDPAWPDEWCCSDCWFW